MCKQNWLSNFLFRIKLRLIWILSKEVVNPTEGTYLVRHKENGFWGPIEVVWVGQINPRGTLFIAIWNYKSEGRYYTATKLNNSGSVRKFKLYNK